MFSANTPGFLAFPAGFDAGFGAGSGSSQNWIQGQNMSGESDQSAGPDWSQYPLQNPVENQDLSWEDSNDMDMTSNGLYWFWDTVWNEPRSRP